MLTLWCLALAQDDMFLLGEEAFKEAQAHFEKRAWFDCIEKAERARNMFLALEDLYASQNKKTEQKEASEYVKRCNQMIKLAADARIIDKKPAPPPPPTPPPPKPEEPKPAPDLLPQSVVLFKKIAAGQVAPDNADVVAPMMTGLKALDGPWKNWARAARVLAARWVKGELKPPEALKEYADVYLAEPMKFDHRGAAKFLIQQAAKVDLDAWRQLRWLALAHICEALIDSPIVYELPTIGEAIDLVKEGSRESWPTREGNLIELTHMAKDIPTIKDPLRNAYRAIYLLEHIEKPSDIAACRAALQNIDPELAAVIKTKLDAAKPCKWCSGTHQRKCDDGCSNGKKQLTCSRCNGLGYIMTRGGTQPCPERPPKKGEPTSHKHAWLVDCPKCAGKSKIACKECKEPWSFKKPESTPCETCGATGWLLDRVKLPCPDCYGIGHRLEK